MPRERTTALFGVRKRRGSEWRPKHPERPLTNSGGALRDASGAKNQRAKGRRWIELSTAMDGEGTAVEAGEGNTGG